MWTGTSARRRPSTRAASRITRRSGRFQFRSGVGRLAAIPDQLSDREPRPGEHADSHLQSDVHKRADLRRQPRAADGQSAQSGRHRQERPRQTRFNAAAVLSGDQPVEPPVPNATFGGVIQNSPQLNIEQRFPFFGTNNIWNWSDNLSKIWGSHNLKAGFYLEYTTRNAARGASTARSTTTTSTTPKTRAIRSPTR